MMQKKAYIWDLSIRIFHWVFALGYAVSMLIATTIDDDGALFDYHALIGFMLLGVVFLRVLYGFIGTKHARFLYFNFSLRDLGAYLFPFATDTKKSFPGHNPASSYGTILMLVLVGLIGITGILAGEDIDFAEDLHEFFAFTMLGLVVVHILGVIVYSLRHRENLSQSMVDGYKNIDEDKEATQSKGYIPAAIFVICTLFWTLGLTFGYDSRERSVEIPFISIEISLKD